MADVIQVVRGQQTQPAQDGADPAKADPQKPPPVEMDIAYMFEQSRYPPHAQGRHRGPPRYLLSPAAYIGRENAADRYLRAHH